MTDAKRVTHRNQWAQLVWTYPEQLRTHVALGIGTSTAGALFMVTSEFVSVALVQEDLV